MPTREPQSDGLGHLSPAQLEAIRETSCSLLVSAAAGSGKTTVLAERCVALVCDVEEPKRCDIDKLLVVTFTDAAAEEMRARIRSALRRRLDEQPDDERLQRQIYLLECASISTIHSFCKTLIERYFPQAEVDPQASVLSEEEADLLRDEVLDELFLSLYASNDADGLAFQALVDDYGAGDDYKVGRIILQIHNFISTLPDPQQWLDDSLRRLRPEDPNSLPADLHAIQCKRLREELLSQMDYCRYLAEAIHATWPVAEMHADSVTEHYFTLKQWLDALDPDRPECWETVAEAIRAHKIEWKTRRPTKLSDEDKAAFDAAKAQRDKLKVYFEQRLRQRLCAFTAGEYREGLTRVAPYVRTLVHLVREFDRRYAEAKAVQAVVDFNDLQRRALRLLSDPDDPSKPSDVARRLQKHYRYVLVDEFQDVDPLQERILRFVSRESADPQEGNLFTVGDIKQSIYRFRLAEPTLFTARADRFAQGSTIGRVIPLQKNYRSRPGVIDAINLLFETLMSRDFGGSDYDDQARLHPGATYPEQAEGPTFDRPAIEMHLLEPVTERTRTAAADDGDEEAESAAGGEESAVEELEGIEREGYLIGRLVRHWMGQGQIGRRWHVAGRPETPGGVPVARPIEYRDIVILLRSLRFKAEPIADVLRRMGVPVRIERQATTLDTTEFRDCMAVLQVLDNLQQDIPLAAVMRSPILGMPFDETELFQIRQIDREVPFHAAVRQYAAEGTDTTIRQKLNKLLERLDYYRTRAQRTPVADVLWELYEEANYLSYVCGLPDGVRRRDHLVQLHELARQFGHFSRQGLRRFLHFLEDLMARDRQPRQAGIGGDENCIRIMTIHASKGLEFPVVIMADLQKSFNLEDARSAVLVDRQHGIAMRASEPEKRILYPTLAHQLAVDDTIRESLAEELRVLYVALTRAREHLVLLGRISPDRVAMVRAMQRANGGADTRRALPRLQLESASCALDWLLAAIATVPVEQVGWHDRQGQNGDPQAGEGPNASRGCASSAPLFAITTYTRAATDQWRIPPAVREAQAEVLVRIARLEPLPDDEPVTGIEDAHRLIASLREAYPAQPLTTIPGRLAVGELKRRWDGSADLDERMPKAWRSAEPPRCVFVTEKAVGDPTVRGSATHRFLQLVDLSAPCDLEDLRRQLTRLCDQGRMSPVEAESVLVESAAWFFRTPLGQRIRACASGVHREVAFEARIDPRLYDPHIVGQDYRDTILVRGVVDLILDAPDGLEIVDYKTDMLPARACEERANTYRAQLDIYALAVEKAFRRQVAHRWLVFLHGRVLTDVPPTERK